MIYEYCGCFYKVLFFIFFFFFFQAEDGIRDTSVTGVQTCALPIYCEPGHTRATLCRIRLAPRSVCWTRAQAFTALCLYIETVAPYRAGRYLPPFNHTGATPWRFGKTQTLERSPPRPLRGLPRRRLIRGSLQRPMWRP